MLTIVDHWFEGTVRGKEVDRVPSENHNAQIVPQFLIFHYTACSSESAKALFVRTTGNNRVSAHLLVHLDGTVTQFVPLNRRAWHAGESSWGNFRDLNTHSIGVEVVNYGYQLRNPSGAFRLDDGTPSPVPTEDIIESRHKHTHVTFQYWHAYTPNQIQTCEELASFLVERYNLLDVLGHDDVAPNRKLDPGPAFPLTRIQARALGRNSTVITERFTYVAVPKLNIRTAPGVEQPLAGGPLVANTPLRVLQTRGGWLQVEVVSNQGLEGWVWEEFTAPRALRV